MSNLKSFVVQSCLTLCDPMDCSTPGLPIPHCLPEFAQFHVHWVSDAIQPSHPLGTVDSLEKALMVGKIKGKRGRRQQRMRWLESLCLVTQLCPALCDPMYCSLPGYSVHGISQARILEWVTMPSSRRSSQPRDQAQVSSTAGGFFTIWPIEVINLMKTGLFDREEGMKTTWLF